LITTGGMHGIRSQPSVANTLMNVLASREKLFTKDELSSLVRCCSEIVIGGSITQDRVRGALTKHAGDLKLSEKFSIQQLITRITFERRKRKL
jgi:hypothetical protein